MSHPDGLPDLFLDRSLGRIRVPALLRAHGLRLITRAEHYGMPADETVKDARVRYNTAERETVRRYRVRCFCLSSQTLSGAAMAERFLSNLDAITRACAEPGPFIYAVHARRVERLVLGESG